MIGGLGWDPPSLVVVAFGLAALAAWMAVAPPWRAGPVRGGIRTGAALLLALALLDVGWSRAGPTGRRLAVLLDVSRSMSVGIEDRSRLERAREWLEGEAFASWTEGWRVVVDSFGGPTTDPGEAVAGASSELPGAIVIVSDGRPAGGRSPEAPKAPLFVHVPEPAFLADASVVELEVEPRGEEGSAAVATISAVGGRSLPAGRTLVWIVDRDTVARTPVGPLAAGDRRSVRRTLAGSGGERIVEVRLVPADAVPENDVRSVVWKPPSRARRALLVGLRPGWEYGLWREALERRELPVDAYWSVAPGRLRPIHGGPETSWSSLEPDRYAALALVGDPAVLGSAGEAWLARFLATGARGVAWLAAGSVGRVEPVGEAGGPASAAGPPTLTEEGAGWLVARGAPAGPAPDGSPSWPSLEAIPEAPRPPPGATVLARAADRAVAWSAEIGDDRVAAMMGTGWYRWTLAGAGEPVESEASRFWEAWSGALVRWLSAASPSTRPLVRPPPGGRLADGAPLIAAVAADVEAAVRWRVVREADGESVAGGTVPAGPPPRVARSGPLDPGRYRLLAETVDGARSTRVRLVVDPAPPDLDWTAADTASLAAVARSSGGSVVGPEPATPLPEEAEEEGTELRVRVVGLGTFPWIYLIAVALLLADWALGQRARWRRPGPPDTLTRSPREPRSADEFER